MQNLHLTIVALFILLCSVLPAHSDTPYLQIYFDSSWTDRFEYCPGIGALDTLYVVAYDFNAFIVGIELRVDYPDEITWIADFDMQPVTLGQSPTGVSTAWSIPQNGFQPILVAKVLVMWNCGDCMNLDIPLCPNAHPISNYLRAVNFPDYEFIYATVRPACTCPSCCGGCICPEPTVPVEVTTWGRIKGLYR